MSTNPVAANAGPPETQPDGEPRLAVAAVSRDYPLARRGAGRLQVLSDVTFSIDVWEFVSIVGPSGCGKSTLLNLIAGLQQPAGGEIRLSGDPDATRLGVVAHMHQRDLLLPWRSIVDNVALGLELRGMTRAEARRLALVQLDAFGLAGFGDSHPAQLSGGMRQRVALLRAMLPDRDILLLDEPFGALDAITRASLHLWLADLLKSSDKTVLLVTHDVEEAVLLSDRVHVMTPRPGRIGATVEVDLPRPRSEGTSVEPRFVELKARLLQELARTAEAAA